MTEGFSKNRNQGAEFFSVLCRVVRVNINYVNIVPDIRSAYKAAILPKFVFKLISHRHYVCNWAVIIKNDHDGVM